MADMGRDVDMRWDGVIGEVTLFIIFLLLMQCSASLEARSLEDTGHVHVDSRPTTP